MRDNAWKLWSWQSELHLYNFHVIPVSGAIRFDSDFGFSITIVSCEVFTSAPLGQHILCMAFGPTKKWNYAGVGLMLSP